MMRPRPTRKAAFIACKESRASAEAAARQGGVDPATIHILSRKDNPDLRTFEDILAALPAGVGFICLDDVEYLLPEGERDPATVYKFLIDLKRRYARRGLHVIAAMGMPTGGFLGFATVGDSAAWN